MRVICLSCKEECQANEGLLEDLGVKFDSSVKFYRGRGCNECSQTGYKGRVVIFELLELNDEIKSLISNDAALEDIQKAAVENGMRSLKDCGLDKVKKGITTLDEVVRVAQG